MNLLDCRGLSLIEVLVSVMFLSITIAGFMTTYIHLSRQVIRMREKRTVIRLAQSKLEECMANPDCEREGTDEQGELSFKFEVVSDEENKLESRVTWTDGDFSGDVSLTTIWGN